MQLSSALLALAAILPSTIATPITAPPAELIDASPSNSTNATTELDLRGIERRSFWKTCEDCNMIDGGTKVRHFQCLCDNGRGSKQRSTLDLDKCLANSDGYVQWRRDGGFSSTCEWSQMGGTVGREQFIVTIHCKMNDRKTLRYNSVNFMERIHNANGNLWCDV